MVPVGRGKVSEVLREEMEVEEEGKILLERVGERVARRLCSIAFDDCIVVESGAETRRG